MDRVVHRKKIYEAGIHEFQSYPSLNPTVGSSVSALTLYGSNVGIGTNVPQSALDVRGNIMCSNISVLGDFVTLNTITSNTEQMVIENAGTGPALKVTQTGDNSVAEFYDKESGVALFVGNGGNVGIGTSVAMSKFHVAGSLSNVIVDSQGYVGIGTVTPVTPFHVEGNMYLNGNISAGNMGMFRNRIINGDMRIDQRANGSAFTVPVNSSITYGSVDRFRFFSTINGQFSAQRVQITDLSGFAYALKITTLTSFVTSGSAALHFLQYNIEDVNVQDLNLGKYTATPFTISFWIKSSVSGKYYLRPQYYVTIQNQYLTYITVNNPNVWEYKTIVIPPAYPNGIDAVSGPSITLTFIFTIALGSVSGSIGGTLNTWVTGNYYGLSDQTNLLSTLNNTLYITGVQLEKGTIATPFEFRPYPIEFQLCQRYFQQRNVSHGQMPYHGYAGGTSLSGNRAMITPIHLLTRMRSVPTMYLYAQGQIGYNASWYNIDKAYNAWAGTEVTLPATIEDYGYDSSTNVGVITILPIATSLPVINNSTFLYGRDLKIDFNAEL